MRFEIEVFKLSSFFRKSCRFELIKLFLYKNARCWEINSLSTQSGGYFFIEFILHKIMVFTQEILII